MVYELDIAPRTRGRASVPLTAELVRELVPADLALLATERGVKPQALVKIRDRHHSLARALASGLSNTEASAITGYDPSRISILKGDTQFQELLAHYHNSAGASLIDFQDRAITVATTVLANLQEMLESEDAPLPAQTQIEIAKFAADRAGHAPVARSVTTSINVDIGNRMQAAARRLRNISPGADDGE